MRFIRTPLEGAYVIEMEPKIDDRGIFARTFCREEFRAHGLKADVVQCNLSSNARRGTVRGLHYQLAPFAEVKMVRCTKGAIYDVIVDIRVSSPSYLQWFGVELTSRNQRVVYVPEGFAHGYETLADDSEVSYMVSQAYAPEYERGIRWNDPSLQIQWHVSRPIVSAKDQGYADYQRVPGNPSVGLGVP
jgi:dTDP-4-dehydrorhamnose 3,5-epimerase